MTLCAIKNIESSNLNTVCLLKRLSLSERERERERVREREGYALFLSLPLSLYTILPAPGNETPNVAA